MRHLHKFFSLIFLIVAFSFATAQQIDTVKNVTEFEESLQKVQPGDSIVLANGTWMDSELLFEANGTAEKPITLTVEEKGKVILEVSSNLRFAVDHLIVKVLVFKNGYTPTNAVISFRKDRENMANNSRLTELSLIHISEPTRRT